MPAASTQGRGRFYGYSVSSPYPHVAFPCVQELGNPLVVTGKVLEQPKVHHGRKQVSMEPSFVQKPIFSPACCRSWAVLNYSEGDWIPQKFTEMLDGFARNHGLEFRMPRDIRDIIYTPTGSNSLEADFNQCVVMSRNSFLFPGVQAVHVPSATLATVDGITDRHVTLQNYIAPVKAGDGKGISMPEVYRVSHLFTW